MLIIEENPLDIEEWIDVVLLALDGAWRAGYTPKEIIATLRKKQKINQQREWIIPDNPYDPIEHKRS